MEFVALGKTNLLVSRTSFGAMSLDCHELEAFGDKADEQAVALVHQAYNAGINFFDTSRTTPVSEARLGLALHGIRQNVILATKSAALNSKELLLDVQKSLETLESDWIDLFQVQISSYLPMSESDDGLYKELCALKKKGVIRHFGIVTESLLTARSAVECGLYETIQFPFNMISSGESLGIVEACRKNEVGCIAMQPLNGGVVNNIPLAFGFLHQFENVVPVWGVHTQEELQQILYFDSHPPIVDEQFKKEVDFQRALFN